MLSICEIRIFVIYLNNLLIVLLHLRKRFIFSNFQLSLGRIKIDGWREINRCMRSIETNFGSEVHDVTIK